MKAISAADMRALDRKTAGEPGFSGERLMRAAGALSADAVMEFISSLRKNDIFIRGVIILAGKGGNAGDAFVAAKLLSDAGFNIFMHCAVPGSGLSGDTRKMFDELPCAVKNGIAYGLEASDLDRPGALILDGLLGTGFHGGLRDEFARRIALANASGRFIVALDVPSGMDADTGEAQRGAIRADLTVTMAFPKKGMLTEAGIRQCGRVKVADIGIPPRFAEEVSDAAECTAEADVRGFFGREAFDIHKNSRGHLLVLGGSPLYSGAPLLSGEAALRTGAGLVSVCLPRGAEVCASVPKALMIRRAPCGGNGFFDASSFAAVASLAEKADAVAVGMGMGTEYLSLAFLERVLSLRKRVLADADALTLLSREPSLFERVSAELVLTPHPGEMARLEQALGLDSGLPRVARAKALASKTNATVVLKGARSVVAAPSGEYAVNLSGTPALATAGSGDVLSGMTGAILARKDLTAFDAVRAAVYVHGFAAELAAPAGSRGYVADDFIRFIPAALRKISPPA